jgi:hypothetical protein
MAQAGKELAPLSDDDLSELRGGFLVADGIAFDFGATVRTSVDGVQILESRITWTPQGTAVETVSGAAPYQLPGGGLGITLRNPTGTTTIGHRLLDGQLQGFILNTADNRNVTQTIDVTLTLPGFDEVQRNMVSSLTGFRVGQDVAQGLIGSGR